MHVEAVERLLDDAGIETVDVAGNSLGGYVALELAARDLTVRFEHVPPELIAHQLVGAARCPAALPLIERGERDGWPLDAEHVTRPVRIVWGAEDGLLPWPRAAERRRRELPQADVVVLDGVGHGPQLDVPLEAADLILGWS